MRYEFLPIGEHDYKALIREYWDEETHSSEYSYATHWLVAIFCFDQNSLRTNTFPCSGDGSASTLSPVRITDFGRIPRHMKDVIDEFEAMIDRMQNDVFWD